MENLEKGPLPERFILVVSYQEGDYLYGKNCALKSLATVLRDPRRRHWMGYVDEGRIPFDEDPSGERTVIVKPTWYDGDITNIYYKGKTYPCKDGFVYWSGNLPRPEIPRGKVIERIFGLIFQELRKISQISASEAWLKDIKLETFIYDDGRLKITRPSGMSCTQANRLTSDLSRKLDGKSAWQWEDNIELPLIEALLFSVLKNYDCPDWLPRGSVLSGQFEAINPQKEFRPIDIPGMKELWEDLKNRFGDT